MVVERRDVVNVDVTARARGLIGQLRVELEALVRIPSVSVPGRIDQPLLDAFELTSQLFADAGVTVGRLDLPDTAPVVTGEIPAPPGAPTVLLYSHYDVVPAGDESEWASPPFEPTERDGALFGRGVADTKSNILAHVGALRAWAGGRRSASSCASRATRRSAAARSPRTRRRTRSASRPTRS